MVGAVDDVPAPFLPPGFAVAAVALARDLLVMVCARTSPTTPRPAQVTAAPEMPLIVQSERARLDGLWHRRVQKNQKRERRAKKFAHKRVRLKAMAKDESLSQEERFNARLKLAELPRNSSPTRVRLRCGLSGRPRGNYRKFKLSRIALRDLASTGQIPGMVKSSW